MQWMARGSNGGYFEMMVGLPRTPAHYYQSLSSPSLAPNPPASSHLNMSNPQKVSSPPPPVSLDIFKTSPDPPLSSPQISSLVVLIRWPRPLCIYSLPTAQSVQQTHRVLSVCASIIYTRIYLYLIPLFVPITPQPNQE